MIIRLYQLYEFSRNSFPLYAESLEALFYFLFNYIDFSPHNNVAINYKHNVVQFIIMLTEIYVIKQFRVTQLDDVTQIVLF